MIIKKSNLTKATLFIQFSMVSNILVGIFLLPFINTFWGQEVLVYYIQLLALKGALDIFTSALSGNFVRLMIENNTNEVLSLSIRAFSLYSFVIIIVYFVFNIVSVDMFINNEICFLIFVVISFLQQPLLQKMTALGYQHLPAIIRFTYNTVFCVAVICSPYIFENVTASFLVYIMLFSSVITSLVIYFFNRVMEDSSVASNQDSNFIVFKKGFINYALFASLFAFTFQIEGLFLGGVVAPQLFILLVVAFKIPNIIIQFLWRFCEVYAVELKRNKFISDGLQDTSNLANSKEYEKKLLIVSLFISFLFLLLSNEGYRLWMGDDFVKSLNFNLLVVFSLFIPILTLNRFYTSYLQYEDYVKVLGFQYLIIVVVKLVLISLLVSKFYLASFISWLFLEVIFLVLNRRRYLVEYEK